MKSLAPCLALPLAFVSFAAVGCSASAQDPASAVERAALTEQALGTLPAPWHGSGASPSLYTMGLDSKTMHDGHASLAIASKSGVPFHPEDFATVMSSVDATPYRGKRVRFRGFVKSDTVTGSAGLWMRVDGPTPKSFLAFDNMQSRPIRGTSPFAPYSVVLDVDPTATKIAYGVLLARAGAVWMADSDLEVVDGSVAVTGNTTGIVAAETSGLDRSWLIAGSAPAHYAFAADASVHRGAAPSLSIAAVRPAPDEFGTAMQALDAGPYRGKRLRFSAFVKASDVRGWSGLWLRVDRGTEVLAFDNMEGRAIVGTSDWTRYEVVLDVANDATHVALGALVAGAGHIWVDTVALEVLDGAVPTTAGANRTE